MTFNKELYYKSDSVNMRRYYSQGDIGGPRAPPFGFKGTIMVELTNLSTSGNCMFPRKKSGL